MTQNGQDQLPGSAACCPVHALGKCDAVFTCCDRCPTFFADRAKPIYGKPFHPHERPHRHLVTRHAHPETRAE